MSESPRQSLKEAHTTAAPVPLDPPCKPWHDTASAKAMFADAFSAVPVQVQGLVEAAVQTWAMRPEVVLLTALHQMAAAFGRLHRARHNHIGFCCPFSVLLCSDQSHRSRFVEVLGDPWLCHVRMRMREHQECGAKEIHREMTKLSKVAARGSQQPTPDFRATEEELDRLQLAMRPHLVSPYVLPRQLMRAVHTSIDRVVLAMDGAVDPLETLLGEHRSHTQQLCRLLTFGWEDAALLGDDHVPPRGFVHLFWRAHTTAVRKVLLNRNSPWLQMPPPVLLMNQGHAPDFLKELPARTREAWAVVLVACHMRRHRRCHITMWKLSDDAKKIWGDFHEEILRDVSAIAPFSPPWFRWLPELMMRLALLLTVLRPITERDAEERTVIEADVVHRACVLTRWLAGEHLACLRSLVPKDGVEEAPENTIIPGIDSIDEVGLEAAILEKLESKGPMSPRELTRSFHSLDTVKREKALSRLIRAGQITKTTYEKLQIQSPQV